MAKQTTYIMSEDARAQAEFYTYALGGEILSIMTHGQLPEAKEELKDKVVNLSLMAGGINFLMSDSVFEPIIRGNAINLSLEFTTEADARDAFDKLAEGGNVKCPLELAFWGALYGHIEDKYGVMWMITTVGPTA
ncbi:VOC family protein [Paenibacillus radicis (ex Xue et al. 2023)]|uniref:VOC family protein n=1 Tax=Paenibacillus radicis (ex Xue et al. 2023) TaxID=2972489 RepID=A0ABT1YI07_9BACL|nr:VOC family protein [Paenibacillus radicis (ex Xue et al. 2023)]MCR8632054.1 VOC family protein [Paenibacillus radicis (ex Xue et al. 2023)]